jgi:hypothetical protein
MLTEIRALGEGLIIADQSPEKLAADAMRNTNVQIAHQLRDSRDREAVARALLMTEEQRDFVGKLQPGHAAVFYTGLERATFVTLPHYTDLQEDQAAAIGLPQGGNFDNFGVRDTATAIREQLTKLGVSVPKDGGQDLPFGERCSECGGKVDCRYRLKLYNRIQTVWPEYLNSLKLPAVQLYHQAVRTYNDVHRALEIDRADNAHTGRERLEIEKTRCLQAEQSVQEELYREARNLALRCGQEMEIDLARCAFYHLCYTASTRTGRELPRQRYWKGFPLGFEGKGVAQ